MAPGSNWLSFALPPMEAMRPSCQSQMLPAKFMPYEISADSSHQYYFQNFDDNGAGLSNMRAQIPYMEESKEAKELKTSNVSDLMFLTSPNPQIQQVVPKLEDFLGGHSTSLGRYSDTQTETQESSLSSVYEQSSSHFSDQQDLNKAIAVTTAFQAFSTTSGSEVDDSFSATGTRLTCSGFGGYSIESGNELVFSDGPRALSLAVTPCSEKAIVSVESESSKKMIDTFGQRTSIFRGVTRHRWTGRYEAHLWDNSCRREGQTRKGRQVYLGGYDKEEKAARAYDLAALKYWGPSATTNFSVSNYTKEIEEMKNMTKQEFIASLRRKSSGFSRGASIYRGVTRHHQQGRWQARIGRVAGNKDLYLGTFGTEEEAAEAYDIAAIKFRGVNAVTNFEMNRYDVEAIASSALPIGGAAKRLKLSLEGEPEPLLLPDRQSQSSSSISFDGTCVSAHVPLDTTSSLYQNNFLQHLQSTTGGTPAFSTTIATATTTSAIVTPTVLYPHPDYYGRSLFYGLTTPINMAGGYSNNNNYSTPNVNPQPWNAGSSN